jgi:hypothetical protein
MHRFALLALAILCLAAPQAAPAQERAQALAAMAYEPRGVYATINMGPTREMMQRLGAAYGTDKRLAIREVRDNAASYQPAVLYALANTLAEDYAEEAIFWYQVGRLRAVYDVLRCRDQSARPVAILELRKLLNLELRTAMYYRRERLVGIAEKAVDWDARNPRKYDQRWPALYGKVAASSAGADPAEVTVPESEWSKILNHVHETHLKSVRDFAGQKPPG